MVDIECTRCGATGTNYPTNYVAKFSLTHETGCGARVGIPKYSEGKLTLKEVEPVIHDTDHSEKLFSDVVKSEKKKTKKKKVHTILDS